MEETIYKCAICGKSHKTVEDRAVCEMSCVKQRKEAEDELKKQKLAEEQAKRKNEIDDTMKKLQTQITAYVKDYGYIDLADAYISKNKNFPSLSTIFGGWWL